MPVSALNFPSNWRLPLYWVEVDPSQAGFPTFRMPALLIGQMATGKTWTAGVPVAAQSLETVRAGAGNGSMLAQMAEAFLANNRAQELWFMPVADPAGAAATGTITVTGTATAGGMLNLYIGDKRVQVSIPTGALQNATATAIAAAINADVHLPVTASATTNVVTLTVKWLGTTGNDIRLADSLLGQPGGELLPVGVTVAYVQMSGGTGVADLATAITNMGDFPYEFVCTPYNDSANLALLETEFGFGDTGRWGWMRQLYGHVFTARRDSYSNHLTAGVLRNSGVVSNMALEAETASPIWKVAAAYTAKAARSLTIDPARPLQTLEFDEIMPAPVHKRYEKSERNAIAGVGLAAQTVFANNKMGIEVEATQYQKNVYGTPDDAYMYVTTLATLSRLFRNQRQEITSKFPRHKLADDGTPFGRGQAIATPNMVKGHLIASYRVDMYNGLVENVRAFKSNLIVERDSNNPNRLNVLYPPDLINQLRIFYVLAQFRLQYDRGVDTTIATA
jgi:phage tail sheath gpL-like